MPPLRFGCPAGEADKRRGLPLLLNHQGFRPICKSGYLGSSAGERGFQFLSQFLAHFGDGGLGLLVFGQEFGGVAVGVVHDIGVFDVEVVAARGDVRDGHAPGEFVFLALLFLARFAPPLLLGVEFLDADRLGFVVALDARRIGVLVIPDVFGRLAFGEEQQVGLDAGVGSEDAVGQADDGVQVALFEQLFLDAGLDAFAEERAVRQDDGAAAAVA